MYHWRSLSLLFLVFRLSQSHFLRGLRLGTTVSPLEKVHTHITFIHQDITLNDRHWEPPDTASCLPPITPHRPRTCLPHSHSTCAHLLTSHNPLYHSPTFPQ